MKSLSFLLLFLLFASAANASDSAQGLVNTATSPFAQIRPVGLDEARWSHGFWADRFELCRTQMIPGMERLMEGTNYSQFLVNFEIAAGLADGKYHGPSFNDGDFYKFLEGASATLALTNDAHLSARLDEIIAIIAKAQETNGYIDTWVQLHQRDNPTNTFPFKDRLNFEVYNLGHLMTAACVHHRATGRTNFLQIAVRVADFLCETFDHPTPELALNSVCPSHYMGIIEMYRTTGNPRYLELAKKFLAMRNLVKDGGSDNQDRIPFLKQEEAEGHAVRANYLYAGAADLYLETGDSNLWKPLATIWTNVVTKKMYITSGCGALYDGAAPYGAKDQKSITRVHQSYGQNYELPNTVAHNETCAAIANAMWNWRMFLATGEAKFVDVVELEFYNNLLAGAGLDGTNFFYSNPLRVTDPMPEALRWSSVRVPYVSSFCCPPNIVRTIAELSGYAFSKSENTIWVNLYGAGSLSTTLPDGQQIRINQETDYPWNGHVRLNIEQCGSKEVSLKLRIPGWAANSKVRINNRLSDAQPQSGSYFVIHRAFKPGDVVDLDLPMPVRLMEANPLVEEDLNQVAVQRGPVVYCLESPDLPAGARISNVVIPAKIKLSARFDPALLGGITVIEGRGQVRQPVVWQGNLYRDALPAATKTINLRLIPYFAWQNRGPSEMSVWLNRAFF